MLDWDTLNTKDMVDAINTARTSEDMKTAMEFRHELFTDQKESPLERAVWWVEYVIRHNGAKFLRPHSLQLTWWQYHLLDVILLILTVVAVGSLVVVKGCCCCFRVCCRRKTKQD